MIQKRFTTEESNDLELNEDNGHENDIKHYEVKLTDIDDSYQEKNELNRGNIHPETDLQKKAIELNDIIVKENDTCKDKDYEPTDVDDYSDEEDHFTTEALCQTEILTQDKSPQKQLKFIVFEESLVKAFGVCRQCGWQCKLTLEKQVGSSCSILVSC